MNIQPLRDVVVAQNTADRKTSPGGIVLPDSAVESTSKAVILAVGPDAKGLHEGQTIIYGRALKSVVDDGVELLLIASEDILAVLP